MSEEINYTSKFTRQDALDDGVLVDVSKMGKEAGFKFPIAITEALNNLVDYNKNGQSFDGRMWDIFTMLKYGIKQAKQKDRVYFTVLMVGGSRKKKHALKALIHGGDNREPVITIMFEDED